MYCDEQLHTVQLLSSCLLSKLPPPDGIVSLFLPHFLLTATVRTGLVLSYEINDCG